MNEEDLWSDLKNQLDGWMNGGWLPNSGPHRYSTGYGGPYQANVTVTKSVFNGVFTRLCDYKKANDALTNFSVNGPPSMSVTDGYDYIIANGPDTRRFVYHVIVSG